MDMRTFTITISGEVPDDVTDAMLDDMAGSAMVQVYEPLVTDPDDAMNDTSFDMKNARYTLVVESA